MLQVFLILVGPVLALVHGIVDHRNHVAFLKSLRPVETIDAVAIIATLEKLCREVEAPTAPRFSIEKLEKFTEGVVIATTVSSVVVASVLLLNALSILNS